VLATLDALASLGEVATAVAGSGRRGSSRGVRVRDVRQLSGDVRLADRRRLRLPAGLKHLSLHALACPIQPRSYMNIASDYDTPMT